MYNQRQSGWADGQLNENHERTDDLDGAAEGDNESSRISVQNQTAPSRPRSRDSYYDRDRDIRDRGEPDYYGSSRSRNHGHTGETRRRRNDSYRDSRDRDRMADYDYDYRDSRRSRQMPDMRYPDAYYGGGGGGYSNSSRGYGAQPPGWMMNARELLERLRVQDPERYRKWYNQYQAHRMNPQQVPNPGLPVFGPSHPPATPVGGYGHSYSNIPGSNHSMYSESVIERPSVHSGRSSVNDELMKLSLSGLAYLNGPSANQTPSINQDPDAGFRPIPNDHRYRETPEPEPKRMTPLKFNTSHCFGVLTPLGQLIKVKNQSSVLEVIQVKSLLNHLPEYKEVESFPGPLVKGTTHKKTVIQFCQKKIKEAQFNEAQVDKEHFILLWELLILLLNQNGNVIGSDVAELLLKSQNSSSDDASSTEEYQSKESSSDDEDSTNTKSNVNKTAPLPVNEAKITEKFCEYLLYGHKKAAIDYAMENGLWGHALFLATKMDERTYGNVMARFANCTAFNHPLQTFYQLMSGKQPASSKSCCDESFGDWKPHLSMVLSNAGSRPDVEFKSIVKMGDTLGSKNFIFAAQFCYLMGQADFSSQSKLGPLLGLNPSAGNIIEATQMTEIYEFARSLAEPSFTLGTSFIQSKLNYAKTLLDLGFVEEAFVYCEEITKKLKYLNVKRSEENIDVLKWSILQIAERLVRCEESETETDPLWIQELRSELTNPATESVSDNLSERRDSVSDSKNRDPLDIVQEGQNVLQEHLPSDQNLYIYGTEPPSYPMNQSQSTFNANNSNLPEIPQYNPPHSVQYPSQPHLPNSEYQQPVITGSDTQTSQSQGISDPSSYQPQQPHYIPEPVNSTSLNQSQHWNSNPNQPYLSGTEVDNHGNVPPSYGGFQNSNNSYLTPGGGYPIPTAYQPPPVIDNSVGGANKKKSVRFEDDEKTEDYQYNNNCIEGVRADSLEDLAKLGVLHVQDSSDGFDFCHPLKPSVRKNYVGYGKKDLNSYMKERNDLLKFERERPKLGSELQLNGDEILEEIDRLAFSSSRSSVSSSVSYSGTYPIDEPISHPLPSTRPLSLSLGMEPQKTFPIDKPCCSENKLCEDHDNFYNGSSGGSVVTTPNDSSPTYNYENGNLTGAGSNSKCHGKGFDPMGLPPLSNQQPSPPQPLKSDTQSANQKPAKSPKSNKGGGGGDIGGNKKSQGGWISGIINKLGMKGPNQMILPDDKDPTIVWDPNTKKWVNTKDDDDEDSGPKGPPPTDMDLMRNQGPMMQQPLPPPQFNPNSLAGPPTLMPQQQTPSMALQQSMTQHQPMAPQQPYPANPGPLVMSDNMPSGSVASNVPPGLYASQQTPQLQENNNYLHQSPTNFQPQNTNSSFSTAPLNNSQDGYNAGPSLNGPTPAPNFNNKYQLPKNRKRYVDVLNPNSNTTASNTNMSNGGVGVGGSSMMSPAGGAPMVPNMFIPSPIMGSGDSGPLSFLTPAPAGPLPAQLAQSEAETN